MQRNKKLCIKCDRLISLSNYTKHDVSCCGPMKPKIPHKTYDWNIIQAYYNEGNSINECCAKFNINSPITIIHANRQGRIQLRPASDATRLSMLKRPRNKPNIEACKRLSISQTLHNRGGKCKWFQVGSENVQGTWERDIALKLNSLNIKWKKCKTPISYANKRYTPDIELLDYNIMLELKGYWWGNDKQKMQLVFNEHPALIDRISIIQKTEFTGLIKAVAVNDFLNIIRCKLDYNRRLVKEVLTAV